MASFLTAQEAESRCRQRVSDVTADIWTSTQMMTALDDSLHSIWTMVRVRGRDHQLERLDVPIASFTLESARRYFYSPAETIGSIRKVEGMFSTNDRVAEIPQSELEYRESSRQAGPTWFRSQTGGLTILGELSRFASVRIWFVRRWPPMHYGVTSALGTTSTLAFATSPIGRIVKRDMYEGTLIEIGSGANMDQIVRITSFDPSTLVATFTPTLGAVVAASTTYSMVVPVNPEHGEYVVEEMAARFLERAGNINYTMAKAERLMRLRSSFLDDLMHRDQDAPPSVYNNR